LQPFFIGKRSQESRVITNNVTHFNKILYCHSRGGGNPVFATFLDSATKPALSVAEWVRNDRRKFEIVTAFQT
jgi:hypothetical protein